MEPTNNLQRKRVNVAPFATSPLPYNGMIAATLIHDIRYAIFQKINQQLAKVHKRAGSFCVRILFRSFRQNTRFFIAVVHGTLDVTILAPVVKTIG